MELYCIEHGTMEKAQALFDTVKLIHADGTPDERVVQIGFVHEIFSQTDHGEELDWCCFEQGWATCPPPENYPPEEDWQEYYEYVDFMDFFFPEPGVEEMDIINANANILLADLGIK